MKQKTVAVYDPNWINPYGMELSSVIAKNGYLVDLWCTNNRSHAPTGVRLRPKLAQGRRSQVHVGTLAIRRILGPLAMLLFSRWKSPLIVVWTRDPWDTLLFIIRARLGGKTIFVYHNPSSVRSRGGLAGLLERELLHASDVCVVHSSRLAAASEVSASRIRVAAHPPYEETTLLSQSPAVAVLPARKPVVAFVGALRKDKGVNDLVRIAESVGKSWILRVLGPDQISYSMEAILEENGVTCEYVGFGVGPSDAELISGLEGANVMIAPYRSVTESGSIHMALSMKVPVLAYESPGVDHIVNAQSMATSPEEFGVLLGNFLSDPWPTYTIEASNLHQRCKSDWGDILDEAF